MQHKLELMSQGILYTSPLDSSYLRKYANELLYMINTIKDTDIQDFTMSVLDHAHTNFWWKPSSREHHMQDERGMFGNLIHTIRVVRSAHIISQCCMYTNLDHDILISAAAIHDVCKRGIDWEEDHAVDEHPRLVKMLVDKHHLTCNHIPEILDVVEHHMGPWGDRMFIANCDCYSALHLADAISARMDEILGYIPPRMS